VQQAGTRCRFVQQNPFIPCNNVFNASVFISDCEFDYTCTDEAMCEEFVCDALATYTRECSDYGFIFLNWRLLSNCCKFISAVTIAVHVGIIKHIIINIKEGLEKGFAELLIHKDIILGN